MKISFDKIPLLNKLPKVYRERPLISLLVIVFLAVIISFLIFSGGRETILIRLPKISARYLVFGIVAMSLIVP